MIPFDLSIRETQDFNAGRNNDGVLYYMIDQYSDMQLLPFMVAMEIPVSIAYPYVKEAFKGLEPGQRCLFNLIDTNISPLNLLQQLLDATYPDCLCIVDNDGEPDSPVICYVYDVQYKKSWVDMIMSILDNPDNAPLHLNDKDEFVRRIAKWRLSH